MNRQSLLRNALLLAVAFATVAVLVPAPATAGCSGICEQSGGSPWCRRCADAGYETGALCQDSGSCGCFYIQCYSGQMTAVGEVDWSDLADVQAKFAALGVRATGECATAFPAPLALPEKVAVAE